MTQHSVDGIEILLWPNPNGMSAFVAPWVFDLEYDAQGNGTIDAWATPLNVRDYPSSVDRYRVLGVADRARILKAAHASRDDYRNRSHVFEQYVVCQGEAGIDEAKFLQIVSDFIQAWRKRQ
jgi:hypothetical protein